MRTLPLVSLALIGLALPAWAKAPPPSVYARAEAAGIEILVDGHLEGSGVIVDPAGYALTAAHVVELAAPRVEVRTARGRVGAQRIALDLAHDLALLKLDPRPDGGPWSALPIAEAPPAAGERVLLFGAPIYRHAVLLEGMIARDTPSFEYLGSLSRYERVVHISGASPQGTSGGPWLDSAGRVVGIQSGVMTNRSVPVGIAYAAPLDAIRSLVATRADRVTATAGVAIEELCEQPAEFIARYPAGTEGLRVTILFEPAQSAGVQRDDLIMRADAQATPLRDDLIGYVRARRPGETVTLTVRRGDAVLRLPVILAPLTPRSPE